MRKMFSRTDDTRGVEAGGWSPPLGVDPIPCVHSALLARQLSSEMPSGRRGPRFFHLSLDSEMVSWGNDLTVPLGVASMWGGLLKP